MPAHELRRPAQAVAEREGLPADWINDAVKGFFSATGRFEVYAELSHLRIFVPHPEYLLAMKCMAMRLGEEFQGRNDVAVLLRSSGIRNMANAEAALAGYYPLDRYPARARHVLEELIGNPLDSPVS